MKEKVCTGNDVRSSRLPSKIWTCSVLLLGFSLGNHALSQCDVQPNQLVTNCDFDSDLTGWTAARGTITHDGAIGSNAAGSLQCVGEIGGAWVWCQPRICVPVSPTTMYGAGFDVALTVPPPNGGTYGPFAEVRYQESTDSTCGSIGGGSFVATGSGIFPLTAAFQQSSGTLTTSVTANSVELEIRTINQNGNNDPGDIFTAHYDDVFFGIGMVPVELQSFSID